jgi:hypothetical protein
MFFMNRTFGMKTLSSILICAATFALAAPKLAAQIVDDFNDGNDDGWTRYDPVGSHPQIPDQATFTLVNGAYRIQVPPSPLPTVVGPARAGSLRSDVVYSNFFVSVDLVDWNDTVNQAFGILARIKEPGLGSTDGYVMTFDFGSDLGPRGDIDITWFTNEDPGGTNGGPASVTGSDQFTMVKGRVYRFQFIGKGSQLTARVYELPDTYNPVAAITGTDLHWESGIAGLLVYDNTSTASSIADATFDNYFSLDYEPPRPKLEILNGFLDYRVSWPAEFTDFTLETTEDVASRNWTPIPPGDIQQNDTIRYYESFGIDFDKKFFRLVRTPTP